AGIAACQSQGAVTGNRKLTATRPGTERFAPYFAARAGVFTASGNTLSVRQTSSFSGSKPPLQMSVAPTTKTSLSTEDFEQLLRELCKRMTAECKAGRTYSQSKPFENRVREVIRD